MQCPNCHYESSRVLDSRPTNSLTEIRRRRECEKCGFRYTTFEKIEYTPVLVVKKDGNREQLDKNKILRGIIRSAEKRPVDMETMIKVTERVFNKINNEDHDKHEISSQKIGDYVMEELKHIDEIAYIRFASVYRQFKDMTVFYKELKEVMKSRENDE